MAKKNYYDTIYEKLTGKKPATTAATRAKRIEQEMSGTYKPKKKKPKNTPKKVVKNGYETYDMDEY